MCSRAVDYAKHGVPVDLSETKLPRYLIPFKPDWHKAEVSDIRDNDYYFEDGDIVLKLRNILFKVCMARSDPLWATGASKATG